MKRTVILTSLAALAVAVVLFLLMRPTVRGIVAEDNSVTFEEVTRNPEKYLYQNVSFKVGHFQGRSYGYEVSESDSVPCRELTFCWVGQQRSGYERYLELAKEGAIKGIVDSGNWELYAGCVLPIELIGRVPREAEDSLQAINESLFRLKERGDDWSFPLLRRDVRKDIVFSGILYRVAGGKAEGPDADKFRAIAGQDYYYSVPKVYLTGMKLPGVIHF